MHIDNPILENRCGARDPKGVTLGSAACTIERSFPYRCIECIDERRKSIERCVAESDDGVVP